MEFVEHADDSPEPISIARCRELLGEEAESMTDRQFDNDCRSDRTRAGMKAALELGRWVFLAPLGYLNAPRAIGKSLIPDPERGPIVRRVFEAYATGRFTKQQVLEQARVWGLTNRPNPPLTPRRSGCC